MLQLDKIHNLDCVKGMKRKIGDNEINLVITSPPYNIGVDYGTYKDDLPWNEYLAWCREWLKQVHRVLKPDGRACINVLVEIKLEQDGKRIRASPFAEFYRIMQEIGFKFAGFPTWIDRTRSKNSARGSWLEASAPYVYNPFEVVIVACKERWKRDARGTSTIEEKDFIMGCSGTWKIKPETVQVTKANFPETLPALCIDMFSYVGDVVLDPFIGSGTTAIACYKKQRHYVGFEINPTYYEIAKKRVKRLENKKDVTSFFK